MVQRSSEALLNKYTEHILRAKNVVDEIYESPSWHADYPDLESGINRDLAIWNLANNLMIAEAKGEENEVTTGGEELIDANGEGEIVDNMETPGKYADGGASNEYVDAGGASAGGATTASAELFPKPAEDKEEGDADDIIPSIHRLASMKSNFDDGSIPPIYRLTSWRTDLDDDEIPPIYRLASFTTRNKTADAELMKLIEEIATAQMKIEMEQKDNELKQKDEIMAILAEENQQMKNELDDSIDLVEHCKERMIDLLNDDEISVMITMCSEMIKQMLINKKDNEVDTETETETDNESEGKKEEEDSKDILIEQLRQEITKLNMELTEKDDQIMFLNTLLKRQSEVLYNTPNVMLDEMDVMPQEEHDHSEKRDPESSQYRSFESDEDDASLLAKEESNVELSNKREPESSAFRLFVSYEEDASLLAKEESNVIECMDMNHLKCMNLSHLQKMVCSRRSSRDDDIDFYLSSTEYFEVAKLKFKVLRDYVNAKGLWSGVGLTKRAAVRLIVEDNLQKRSPLPSQSDSLQRVPMNPRPRVESVQEEEENVEEAINPFKAADAIRRRKKTMAENSEKAQNKKEKVLEIKIENEKEQQKKGKKDEEIADEQKDKEDEEKAEEQSVGIPSPVIPDDYKNPLWKPPTFKVGDKVLPHALQRDTDLEGEPAIIVRRMNRHGEWLIRMNASKEYVWIHPKNLIHAEDRDSPRLRNLRKSLLDVGVTKEEKKRVSNV